MTDLRCPICDRLLIGGADPNVFICDRPPDELDLNDKEYVIWIDKDGDYVKIIDVLPYTFTITKTNSKENTRVSILTYQDFPNKRVLLDVPAVMDLPWHDKTQLISKLNLYLTFS